jgi:hypothetical protein
MKKKNTQNFKKTILSVLAVLVVVIGFSIYRTNNSNLLRNVFSGTKAEWSAADFERCGVSFKYQSVWKNKVKIASPTMCNAIYRENIELPESQDTFVMFDASPDTDSHNAFINKLVSMKVATLSNRKINESSVQVMNYSDLDGKPSKRVYFFKKGNLIFSVTAQYEKGNTELQKTLEEIAAAVKFTKIDSFYNNFSLDTTK